MRGLAFADVWGVDGPGWGVWSWRVDALASQGLNFIAGESIPADRMQMIQQNQIPARQADALAFMVDFSGRVSTGYASVGVSKDQSLTLATTVAAAVTAVAATTNRNTRTKALTQTKNLRLGEARVATRQVINVIEGFPGLTPELRTEFLLITPKRPTPHGPPTQKPAVEVTGVDGWTVFLKTLTTGSTRMSKPSGCVGYNLYYAATAQPATTEGWTPLGLYTEAKSAITLPSTLAAGTPVFFVAQYVNTRGETGPGSPIVTTNLIGGTAQLPTARKMKISKAA